MSLKHLPLIVLAMCLLGCASEEGGGAYKGNVAPEVNGPGNADSVVANISQGPAGGEVNDQTRPVGTEAHSDSIGEAAATFPSSSPPGVGSTVPPADQGAGASPPRS